MGGWVLTAYDDVALALSDPRFSAAGRPPQPRYGRPTTMVTSDPPQHTRLRRLVSKAFTARAVERLRPRIQDMVDGLLDAVREAGWMDIVQDLSYPLPVSVIAEMLGVAPVDRPRFKRWASDGLAGVVGRFASPEERERARRSGEELQDYFLHTIAERRRQPGDDLVSSLIAAQERGQALDDEEVLDNCTLLITAGHETTTNLIGNGMLALFRRPDQLQRLRDDPSLMSTAVEELLRFDPAVQTVTRRSKEDVLPELPPKRYCRLDVEIDQESRLRYEAALKEGAEEFRVFGETRKLTPSIFTILNALRQIAGQAKVPFALEWLRSAIRDHDKPCLVFCHHLPVIDRIADGLRASGISVATLDGRTPNENRQRAVDVFQAGEADAFVATPAAGGVGLTLTRAHDVVFVERQWAPAIEDQGADRAHRIGQTGSVTVWFLVSDTSIDQKLQKVVEQKRELVDRVLGVGETEVLSDLVDELRRVVEKLPA